MRLRGTLGCTHMRITDTSHPQKKRKATDTLRILIVHLVTIARIRLTVLVVPGQAGIGTAALIGDA
jgi:hypothetical protein